MNKILIIALLFISSLSAQQYYYTFYELKGMEDDSGNTQLFYRLYNFHYNFGYYHYSKDIYRYNPLTNSETFFLSDGTWLSDTEISVDDYDFWENDYKRFIWVSTYTSLEPFPQVHRYNQQDPIFAPPLWGLGKNIELSRQDTNIIFVTFDTSDLLNFKSTDWGNTWDTLAPQYQILSVSPFNHNFIFARQPIGLYRSSDGGLTFSIVDTFNYYNARFFYDKDSLHIFSLVNNRLKVSNNRGNAFSWTERYSSSNPIFISIDYSQSGSIYLADGRYIYHSTDYGETFNEYKVLDRRIVGIYKKPNSDKLYGATKYDLYEITPDTLAIIKHLPIDPEEFEWYPLQVGNEWIYDRYEVNIFSFYNGKYIKEVIGDTLFSNDFSYFKIKETDIDTFSNQWIRYSYLRIDSTNGRVYQNYSGEDKQLEDFLAESGDTIFTDNGFFPWYFVESEEPYSIWGIDSRKRNYSADYLASHHHSLVKEIGLYNLWESEEGGYEIRLNGFIRDGIIYGDTTTVDVMDFDELPKEFSLSQNYPNPFNPLTKIKYSISKTGQVVLKVYDLLGREIITLVNEEKSNGSYEVEFDASNLSSGIYYYELQAGDFVQTNKMILLK